MRRFYTHLPERRLIAHQQNTLHCFEGLRAIRQRFRSADVPARVDAGCAGEHVEGSCYALKAKWQACPEGSDGVARMVQEQRAGKPMGLRSLSSLVSVARMVQEQRADERASVLSSRFSVLGSWFLVLGSWFLVLCYVRFCSFTTGYRRLSLMRASAVVTCHITFLHAL